MEFIDGDIARHIWGFFLHFDETVTTTETIANNTRRVLLKASQRQRQQKCTLRPSASLDFHDRRIDFRSIRSLRSVNKFFRKNFDELCGWSRCALAMKREYTFLKNIKCFGTWNLRQQPWAVAPGRRATADAAEGRGWTPEKREEAARMVTQAMEQKKAAVSRRNQILRLLNRGPFTMEEKRLTYKQVCVVQ